MRGDYCIVGERRLEAIEGEVEQIRSRGGYEWGLIGHRKKGERDLCHR